MIAVAFWAAQGTVVMITTGPGPASPLWPGLAVAALAPVGFVVVAARAGRRRIRHKP